MRTFDRFALLSAAEAEKRLEYISRISAYQRWCCDSSIDAAGKYGGADEISIDRIVNCSFVPMGLSLPRTTESTPANDWLRANEDSDATCIATNIDTRNSVEGALQRGVFV
jgi:hypothetical protein